MGKRKRVPQASDDGDRIGFGGRSRHGDEFGMWMGIRSKAMEKKEPTMARVSKKRKVRHRIKQRKKSHAGIMERNRMDDVALAWTKLANDVACRNLGTD